MLIAHNPGTSIGDDVIVWEDSLQYLSLDDNQCYPKYIAIDTIENGNRMSRFYQLYGMAHPKDRDESNLYKVSRIWYTLIKEDVYQGTTFKYSHEPACWASGMENYPHGRLTAQEVRSYLDKLHEVKHAHAR